MGLYARHLRPRLLEATLGESLTGQVRARVCAGLAGEVLEIGFGSGLNLPHLPAQVRSLAVAEPSEVADWRPTPPSRAGHGAATASTVASPAAAWTSTCEGCSPRRG